MRILRLISMAALVAVCGISIASATKKPAAILIKIDMVDPRFSDIVKRALRHEIWVQQSVADGLLDENEPRNQYAASIIKDSGWNPGDSFEFIVESF